MIAVRDLTRRKDWKTDRTKCDGHSSCVRLSPETFDAEMCFYRVEI